MLGNSQDAMSCPVNRLLEICIVKDNVRALSTEFKSDVLEVALGSSFHNLSANDGRASEGDLIDTIVLADGLTSDWPVSNDEVKDTRGEANFIDHVSDHESGQRGKLGGLHDNGVSGSKSGANLPAQHQDCEDKYVILPALRGEQIAEGTYEGSSRG